jgi:sulfotransferase
MIKETIVGTSMGALRQAWLGDHAGCLIAVRYESLTENPAGVIKALYEELGEAPFAHNYDQVEYDAPEFDAYIGIPGFHKVSGSVRPNRRQSILPPDIFSQYDSAFWESPEENPRGVTIL